MIEIFKKNKAFESVFKSKVLVSFCYLYIIESR